MSIIIDILLGTTFEFKPYHVLSTLIFLSLQTFVLCQPCENM